MIIEIALMSGAATATALGLFGYVKFRKEEKRLVEESRTPADDVETALLYALADSRCDWIPAVPGAIGIRNGLFLGVIDCDGVIMPVILARKGGMVTISEEVEKEFARVIGGDNLEEIIKPIMVPEARGALAEEDLYLNRYGFSITDPDDLRYCADLLFNRVSDNSFLGRQAIRVLKEKDVIADIRFPSHHHVGPGDMKGDDTVVFANFTK